MATLSQPQREWLQDLSERAAKAQAEVWDAYETTYMSDAKSAVLAMQAYVRDNTVLPAKVTAELMVFLDAAWDGIILGSGTDQRAMRAHFQLAEAGRFIESLLHVA